MHLFERECSIQRRHQKVIEESPSIVLDHELREAMTDAAVRGAKAIDYVNAGTFEFLLTPERKFYFLEVNTRLQVEHPVTEMVTGLDLVRLQILVAAGEPLPPEAHQATVTGHAIEARLCAEDPRQDYRPAAGKLHRFRISASEGVRVDSAIDDAGFVSPFYDSMLAKVIVHAPTREEAAKCLSRVLADAQIHGLQTNRELLVRTLTHRDFLAGETDTHFLERHDPVALGAPLGDVATEQLHAAAAALAGQAERRLTAAVLRGAPSGWRNNPSQPQRAVFQGSAGEILVEYAFSRTGLNISVGGNELPSVRCLEASPAMVRLELDGVERTCAVERIDNIFYVDSPLGSTALTEWPRFPPPADASTAGSLVAPLPGVVNQLKVKPGDTVAAGDVLLVIDSMKLLHEIAAPQSGTVIEIRVEAGHQVDAGTLLIVIEEAGEAATQ